MSSTKWIVTVVIVLAILGGLFLVLTQQPEPETPALEVELEAPKAQRSVIGMSVEGRELESYTYGNGENHLLFVGGIHGGYEWNTVVLADQVRDYLDTHPEAIPENVTVTIIPSLNPDGVVKIIGVEGRFTQADVSLGDHAPGRFNAHGVDLNRNFDCKWQRQSSWRGNPVSAGTAAFSEPEALALKNFVEAQSPDAVIFWHSKGDAVYASECEAGILPETLTLMNTYATAAGYTPIESFDAYPITGDAEGWLASLGIPALTVELATHETIEFEQNLAGMTALFSYYSQQELGI